MGARGKREAFSKRLWKTPLHVCTCSQPFPKRLSRPEFPAFSTIAAASIGHALQHKSDPPKRQENPFFQHARDGDLLCRGRRGARALWLGNGLSGPRRARPRPDPRPIGSRTSRATNTGGRARRAPKTAIRICTSPTATPLSRGFSCVSSSRKRCLAIRWKTSSRHASITRVSIEPARPCASA